MKCSKCGREVDEIGRCPRCGGMVIAGVIPEKKALPTTSKEKVKKDKKKN